MLAITLDTAKNIGIAVTIIFVVGAIASAWIMKTILQKVATALVLALLAFAVYSQNESLQGCADNLRANYAREGTTVTVTDTDCTFFGVDVTVSDPRGDES